MELDEERRGAREEDEYGEDDNIQKAVRMNNRETYEFERERRKQERRAERQQVLGIVPTFLSLNFTIYPAPFSATSSFLQHRVHATAFSLTENGLPR